MGEAKRMTMQETISAQDIESNDGVIFGSELYRVYYATPNQSLAKDTFGGIETKLEVPKDTIHIALISDQRVGHATKIMVHLMMHKDAPITVIRARGY